MTAPAGSSRAGLGVALALLSVAIWGGYFVAGRAAALSGIDPFDLTLLRIGVSGLVLAPVAWRTRRMLRPGQIAAFVATAGAPYVLTAFAALAFAPASHGAVLQPGTVPLFAAALGVAWLGERVGGRRAAGLALCAGGVVAVGWHGLAGAAPGAWIGYLMFVAGAMAWAFYTVAARAWGVAPWAATAALSTWSAILYAPPYLLLFGTRLAGLPWREVVFQAAYQGLATGIVALAAWSRAVAILGTRCGAFTALVPCVAALLALPLLGEPIGPVEAAGIAAVALGLYVTLDLRRGPRREQPARS
ncbi:MAG: DMT family transporter [Alphaproteobacteria bacterium]|nr:DMT family transporter [Alphaproteobacteria bacterium]